MITGTTELFCISNIGTSLTKGGVYTLNKISTKANMLFVNIQHEEYQNKWFSIDRFEVIDHVDISELTQILEN